MSTRENIRLIARTPLSGKSQGILLSIVCGNPVFPMDCYLRRFSESRSSSGSTPSIRLSVRPKHFRVPSLCNL